MMNCRAVLGPDGPLAQRIANFSARNSQQDMAAHIEQVLADQSILVAESGTGTGKTFAYLVPALLSGRKVLISTGTRNLQDQLFHRDLPMVRDALALPVTTALLKGRANYLCLHRLERAELEAHFSNRRETGEARGAGLHKNSHMQCVREWGARTRSGDISELVEVPEDSDIWPRVTSTPDNCLGSNCERYNDCFVNQARRDALGADVLVVNHHLFFADLALREEGFGQLLPGVEAVIFDEAHQLPEIASNFFGQSLSSQQLISLCRDTVTEEIKENSAVAGLQAAAGKLEKSVADLRLNFGVEPQRAAWGALAGRKGFQAALHDTRQRLTELTNLLDQAAARGTGLAGCFRRASSYLDRLLLFSDNPPPDTIPWFETGARSFLLRLTPMDVATPFRACMADHPRAWVFTSATLAVDGNFDHFLTQLGLEEVETAVWESPFDYARQTLLYLPQNLPEPAAPDYTERLLEAALPVLEASRGRAFLLFTSHRALKFAADWLPGRIAYPLLVQGTAPRAELLERFRRLGNAVLLGTGSFWEGVDVRGEALSCVIIDKLPFAAPDDPVLQARAAAMQEAGRSPFMDYQLPNAVIALKQGVGRLIRDEQDRGVLMLCDPRLRSKGYGKIFLASLPAMPRTRALADVQKFFMRTDRPEVRSMTSGSGQP
jgi:ATP-dependent DNA helicase DinG